METAPQRIRLTTEQELRIFMDPLRQRLLARMELIGTPVTAKKLADALGIAPSSAKHHLRQLERIGVVLRDHQETIHGIVATFYRLTEKEVGFDCPRDGLWDQKRLLLENRSRMVQDGFFQALSRTAGEPEKPGSGRSLGTRFEAGVLHLTPLQLRRLDKLIQTWTAAGRVPAEDTIPVRYCLVSYEAEAEQTQTKQTRPHGRSV